VNIKQSHHAHQTEIFTMLDEIMGRVKYHCDNEVLTWEDVGDLVHIENTLGDLLAFLKGKE
jgi:hypothetical protein